MYRHILVPVAYEADHPVGPALQVARRLAAPGARLTLLHVMDEAPAFAIDYLPAGWRDEMRAAIAADLAERLAGAGVDAAEGAVAVLEGGSPGRDILQWARENAVDCIVIASHRPEMHGLILGSTATRVVRDAACAVHVLRPQGSSAPG